MMATTPRLKLSLLAVGQAQKEVVHNEALIALDALVQSTCLTAPSNTPPPSPSEGDLFICGPAPTADWNGRANSLAMFTSSGWRFVVPADGCSVVERGSNLAWRYSGGQWAQGIVVANQVKIGGKQVLGSQAAAITSPLGGATIDNESRVAIGQILSALRAHGLIAT